VLAEEGGLLTPLGIKSADFWRFRLVRDESTLADLLSEEDRQGIEFWSESDWVDSFEDALQLLDKYPWHWLHALQVHPDFRRQIWAAVQDRTARERQENKWARRQLSEWQRVCHGEASHPREGQIAIDLPRR
jgi:hypothetical protein